MLVGQRRRATTPRNVHRYCPSPIGHCFIIRSPRAWEDAEGRVHIEASAWSCAAQEYGWSAVDERPERRFVQRAHVVTTVFTSRVVSESELLRPG